MTEPAAAGVRRKVLDREDFGLCVCWPKTLWRAVPAPGEAVAVLVDGRACEARVETERCNCRGNGWHEHRFLALPAEAQVAAGQWAVIAVRGDTHDLGRLLDPLQTMTMGAAIDEVNEAALFRRALTATRRKTLGTFIAKHQGLPGAYGGLFAPVEGEIAGGYRVFTGEQIRSGAGARHIIGEEALRALLLLEREGAQAHGRTFVSEAIERASAAMNERLARSEPPGWYCCKQCSVALWRTLAAGGLDDAEERLAAGLRRLRGFRDGVGAWRGFPFYYTLSALVEADLKGSRDELQYARAAIERRLARPLREPESVHPARRCAVMEGALARVG